MTRVKRGVASGRRHKKILSLAKGYKWLRNNVFKAANQAVIKAGLHSYMDRKKKKRTFRNLWIQRINSGLIKHGIKYSEFIYKMQNAGIRLNRKMLSNLAAELPQVFDAIVEKVKK